MLRALERIGKGVRDVPRDALIGLSEEKGTVGQAFGFRRLMDNMGAILGPLIATILIALLYGGNGGEEAYRVIFAIAVIPALIAVAVLAFIQDKSTEKTPMKSILRDVFQSGQFRSFLIAGFVVPLVLIPVVYLAYNVFYMLFSLPAGMIADRFGAKKPIMFGMLLFLAALIGFAFFLSPITVFVCFALLGFFMAIAVTAPQILLVRTVSPNYYASAIGAYKGLVGASALPANLVAGVLYTVIVLGTPATFIFSILAAITGFALMAALVKE